MPRINVAVFVTNGSFTTRLLTVVTLRDCLFAYRMLAHKLLRFIPVTLDDELRTDWYRGHCAYDRIKSRKVYF